MIVGDLETAQYNVEDRATSWIKVRRAFQSSQFSLLAVCVEMARPTVSYNIFIFIRQVAPISGMWAI